MLWSSYMVINLMVQARAHITSYEEKQSAKSTHRHFFLLDLLNQTEFLLLSLSFAKYSTLLELAVYEGIHSHPSRLLPDDYHLFTEILHMIKLQVKML